MTGPAWTAVILAGGRSRRLGGADKTRAEVHGRTLLDHILDDLPGEIPVIVVGAERPTSRTVLWCREDPEFAGPAAALAAALTHVATPRVGLLAGDMPDAVPVLLSLIGLDAQGSDAVVAIDAEGRLQPLCAVLACEAVREALAASPSVDGLSLRELFARMSVRGVPMGEGDAVLLADIDSPADLDRARDARSE